jgi:hypothetical protein
MLANEYFRRYSDVMQFVMGKSIKKFYSMAITCFDFCDYAEVLAESCTAVSALRFRGYVRLSLVYGD